MFVKNASELLRGLLFDEVYKSDSNITGVDGTMVRDVREEYSASFAKYRIISYPKTFMKDDSTIKKTADNGNSISNTSYGIAFGDGSTPVTKDDITLSGNQVNGISTSNTTIKSSVEEDDSGVNYTFMYTITNTNEEDMTISEIGLFGYYYARSGSGAFYNSIYLPYLIERTVLECPVTIPPDGIGQVTYTIRMNYPVE